MFLSSQPALLSALLVIVGALHDVHAQTSQTFQQCLTAAKLSPVAPSSAAFRKYTAPFNSRFTPRPFAAIIPSSAADVQAIVRCARSASNAPAGGLKVNALSGGHSYAAYGTVDEHVIVDMQKLNGITVSADGTTVTVGPGARLGNLALALAAKGRALPHGTCPGVGVGGHIHGGYGFSSRLWGLTVDHITEATVVLSSGSIVTVSATSNPDLFFGIRGAPSSLGIVTSIKLKTEAAPSTNVQYTYGYNRADLTVAKAVEIFTKVQAWAITTPPPEFSISFYQDTSSFTFNGIYHGRTQAQFKTLVDPLIKTLPKPSWTEVKSANWTNTLVSVAFEPLRTDSNYPFNTHDTFYAKSLTVPDSNPLTNAALTRYFTTTLNAKSAGYNWFTLFDLYGGANSRINKKELLATSSYGSRSALWVIQVYASNSASGAWSANTGYNLLDSFLSSITLAMSTVRFGNYVNYVDPRLSRSDALDKAYGAPPTGGQTESQLVKLRRVKKNYDSVDMFQFAQSVNIV